MDIQQHTVDAGTAISTKTIYGAAGGAVYFGLTLNEIGVLVGIAGVIIGVIVNIVFRTLSYRLEKQDLNRRRQKLKDE